MTSPTVPTAAPARSIATVPIAIAIGVLVLRPILFATAALGLTAASVPSVYMNLAVVVIDVITLVVVALVMRRQGKTIRDLLGPTRGAKEIGWCLLTAVIVVVGFFAATFIGNLIVYQGAPPAGPVPVVPLWLGLTSLLVMPVTIAFAEELAYRGLGQWSVAKATSPLVGLLVMAVLFGIQHIWLALESPQAALARFLGTFLAGLMFGGLLLWQKRLVPLIFGHWFLDLLGLGLPMLALSLGAAG